MKYASHFSECVSRPPATISVYGAMEVEQTPCGDDEVDLSGRCVDCEILCLGSREICPTPCLGGVPLRGAYCEPSTYDLTGDEINTKCCFWKEIAHFFFQKMGLYIFLYLKLLTFFQLREKGIGYILGTSMVCHRGLHVHVISQDLI